MLKYLILLVLGLSSCMQNTSSNSLSPADSNFVIYGQKVSDQKVKEATVSFRNCTGSYIGNNLVLTAAHCAEYIKPGEPVDFEIGGSQTLTCEIVASEINSKYKKDEKKGLTFNDIAIVKFECTESQQELISKVTPYQLDLDGSAVRVGSYKAGGYGGTEKLLEFQFPNMTTVDYEKESTIREVFQDAVYKDNPIKTKMVQTGSMDEQFKFYEKSKMVFIFKVYDNKVTYFGDSGGPVYFYDPNGNFYLTGIISTGIGATEDPWDVKTFNYFADFPSRISYYKDWINEKVIQYNH